ncbi:MAG: peptidoglycan DD-metalloendopeptidase family protein [Muricoprocola sp.]
MQREKVLDFLKKKGTLGVCALGLVGAMAFASYRTSTSKEQEDNLAMLEETEVHRDVLESEEAAEQSLTAENTQPVEVISEGESVMPELEEQDQEVQVEIVREDGTDSAQEDIQTDEDSEEETEKTTSVSSANIQAEIWPTVNFQEDSVLTWPAAGTVLMDYNMSGTVYYKTLNQYKYNPALILGSEVGNPVVASAKGIVDSIEVDEETGTTLTMNIGNDYSLIYGQLKDVAVSEGEVVEQGEILGYISEPTKYYCEEGANLYFQMEKDGQPVDPMLYLES